MNFIYTLKNFKCNKHCPYCIAKIHRQRKPEDIDMLPEYLQREKDAGKVFEEFVLSSNGEPTMYPIEKLQFIVDTVNNSGMFKTMRVQTSGMLYAFPDKLKVFKGWLKEITVVDTTFEKDSAVLKYRKDYFGRAFKLGELRSNLVILKDLSSVLQNIEVLLLHSDTVALKVLDGSNPWIRDAALPWSEADELVRLVSTQYGAPEYNSTQGRYIWKVNDKSITMSYGKKRGHDIIVINLQGDGK